MTSISYPVVGVPNDYKALTKYIQAFISDNCSANLNTWDNENYTIDVYYLDTPTDKDVQYVMDLMDAYQDPPYFLSYQETQINCCQSSWSASAVRQILTTNQIPAYIVQPILFNSSPSFVINTIKWLLEFDMSDPVISDTTTIAFDLVDISNPMKQVLKSLLLTVGEVRAGSLRTTSIPQTFTKTLHSKILPFSILAQRVCGS